MFHNETTELQGSVARVLNGSRTAAFMRELSIVGSIEDITMYQTVEGNGNFHSAKGSVDG